MEDEGEGRGEGWREGDMSKGKEGGGGEEGRFGFIR